MYGGDEVSAIVIDCGSHTCKAGYAGEDSPKAVFPSVVGEVLKAAAANGADADAVMAEAGEGGEKKGSQRKFFVGTNALGYRRDDMEVVPCLKEGLVADWDVLEAIWAHALKERLMIDPKEHPMLIAEPSHNTLANREKTVALMFEKFAPPALFMAKNAVLTSFATGRATSLVVDSGGCGTTVAAVHDGLVLQKAITRSPIGGDVLTSSLLKLLESKGANIRPRYSFKRKEVQPGEFQVTDLDFPNTTASYRHYMQAAIAADIKETVCRVPDQRFEESSYENVPTTEYELPDGNTIEVGSDRFKIPEILFQPELLKTIPGHEGLLPDGVDPSELSGLPAMIVESINKCDVDIRRELFNGILLAGGSTLFNPLKDRLEKELVEVAPQGSRVKVIASSINVEKRFSSWIGGSILASLGSFQQMWMSKAEYEEHGAAYVHRKCP